jgi:hypothetical protein
VNMKLSRATKRKEEIQRGEADLIMIISGTGIRLMNQSIAFAAISDPPAKMTA